MTDHDCHTVLASLPRHQSHCASHTTSLRSCVGKFIFLMALFIHLHLYITYYLSMSQYEYCWKLIKIQNSNGQQLGGEWVAYLLQATLSFTWIFAARIPGLYILGLFSFSLLAWMRFFLLGSFSPVFLLSLILIYLWVFISQNEFAISESANIWILDGSTLVVRQYILKVLNFR